MKRREFIRLGGFLTVSVAAMGMTGCDIVGDSSDTSASPLDTNSYPTPSRPMPAAATGAAWSFPQSVASGDPKESSIILWTRLLDDAAPADPTVAMTVSAAITLTVSSTDNSALLGTNTALSDSNVASVTVPAYADYDGTVRHKLTGLAPDTVYFYQFTAGTVRSKVGRFKTAPAAATTRDVKFAVLNCQDWSYNHWAVLDQMKDDDTTPAAPTLDFVVHLGDYIYETNNGGVAAEEALHAAGIALPVGTSFSGGVDAYASDKSDYRYLYKLYRSDARLQAIHERYPFVCVWDDHEFSDDCWGDVETYDNDNQAQLSRRRNANQAWFEYMPADVTFQETNPSFQNIQLYRDLQFGTVMHLIMTDERLYKQDHLIPENTVLNGNELGRINSRYLAPEATLKYVETVKDAAMPNLGLISILGPTQRAWWKDKMLNSTATWKIWGNEVSLLRMSLNGTDALGTLIALGSVSTLASGIGSAAAIFGGNMNKASCYVGAVTFGAPSYPGSSATVVAVTAMDAAFTSAVGGGLNPANPADQPAIIGAMVTAGMTNGLTQTQATVGAIAYLASLSATAGGASAQAAKAAQAIAIGSSSSYFGATDTMANVPCIRNEIRTNKTSSTFFLAAMAQADAAASLPAGTTAGKVAPFFQKFVINADQWDGYRKERAELMQFLVDNAIQNVVAVTGDLHAFFAGTVYNEFKGEVLTYTDVGGNKVETSAAASNGTAAMVDFVTAGVSSTSWFTYLAAAAAGLDPTNALIGKLVYYKLDVSALFGESAGTTYANLNLLDYTMGHAAPANATELAAQLRPQLQRLAVAKGMANDASVDATASALQAGLAGNASFQQLVGLAQMLAALGKATNPWINAGHVSTEAQGYSLFTVSTLGVKCTFRKVNPLVGTAAPSASRRIASETTYSVAPGSAAVTAGALF